jgi:hypothetical protein
VLLGEKIEARKEENRGRGRGDKESGTSPPDLLTWPDDVNITTGRPSPPDLSPQKKPTTKKLLQYQLVILIFSCKSTICAAF